MKTLNENEKAYIAGFIDGDGCILAQIIPRKDYVYKFQIRVSVTFYQKKNRHWFILWLHKKLKGGVVRIRNDDMSEYTITGFTLVRDLLTLIYPFLIIKRPLAKLILKIIDEVKTVNSKEHFLEVCKLVDKVAQFTDSKKRKNTSQVVKSILFSPVETSSGADAPRDTAGQLEISKKSS